MIVIRSFALSYQLKWKKCDALGGQRLKYPAMKEELLVWYKNQHRGGSKYWHGKLQEAQCKLGESLKLYSIQLKELGQKAFPHSERDCVKEIKGKFLQPVPSDFAKHVSRTEEMLIMVGRKMTYADLIQ